MAILVYRRGNRPFSALIFEFFFYKHMYIHIFIYIYIYLDIYIYTYGQSHFSSRSSDSGNNEFSCLRCLGFPILEILGGRVSFQRFPWEKKTKKHPAAIATDYRWVDVRQ